jgi:hypothetical protein
MMPAVPGQALPLGPVDSLEVRWIVPGLLEAAVQDWFARFRAGTEAREDTYLVWPPPEGLSVKLRGGSVMDVKSYLGSPGVLGLPAGGGGRLESWRKWSFPYSTPRPAGIVPPGWVTVRKARRSVWFPLAAQDPVPGPSRSGTGCMAELTEAGAGGLRWWTVGLEATGPAGLLLDAVQRAAGLLFASPLPAGTGFSLDNSRSYAQWLYHQPGGVPGELPEV